MRKALVTAIALVVAGSLVGPAAASTGAKKKPPVKLSGSVNNKGTAKAENGAADISAGDFFFDATFIKAPKGETVSVTVTNDSSNQHTFTIDKLDLDETLDPGKSVTVDVEIPANGKPVAGYCRFHKGSGMQFAFFSKSGAKAKSTTTDSTGSQGGYGY